MLSLQRDSLRDDSPKPDLSLLRHFWFLVGLLRGTDNFTVFFLIHTLLVAVNPT